MINLDILAKHFYVDPAIRKEAEAIFPPVEQLKKIHAYHFINQLITHGVAVHKNREDKRSKTYSIRQHVRLLLEPYGITIIRRRMTKNIAEKIGLDETFTFYMLARIDEEV